MDTKVGRVCNLGATFRQCNIFVRRYQRCDAVYPKPRKSVMCYNGIVQQPYIVLCVRLRYLKNSIRCQTNVSIGTLF